MGVWSVKGRKLRIILQNILFHKNTNITLLSTSNVLPLYWTLRMLFPIVIITWIILSLFYRRGNRGSERLNDLPKVTHILSGRTGIQMRSFWLPSLSLQPHWSSQQCWQKADLLQCDMILNIKWHLLMKLRKPQLSM